MMIQGAAHRVVAKPPKPAWVLRGDAMQIRESLYRVVFKHLLFHVEGSNCLQ
jgi:hypothetical protein